jgi:hypothetical protein
VSWGDFLLWAGYAGVSATLLITVWAKLVLSNMRGRHFAAAAVVPFVIALVVVALLALVAVVLHLTLGWRWPLQAYGMFPTSLIVIAPIVGFARRIWKRR